MSDEPTQPITEEQEASTTREAPGAENTSTGTPAENPPPAAEAETEDEDDAPAAA